MVGSKPNAYLTEEARLEAQRRMLAERYGLLSDDSDDDDAAAPPSADASTGPANGLTNGNGATGAPEPNGRDPDPTSAASPADDPAPSEAATYGEGSSVHDGDLAAILSQEEGSGADPVPADQKPSAESRTAPTPGGRAAGWPGAEIKDASGRICAHYEYLAANHKDAVSTRELRVSQITVYASQFLEKHGRKIAVNDQIITYAVGGHIRAILRNSAVRALLKGHESAVADIEFLGHEKRLEPTSGDSISVLGSVAEDGSVYVWKIVRNDDAKDDTLEVADAIRFEHPDIGEGRSYNRIAFRPGPSSIIAEKGIGVAMILMDAESADVRVVELVKMNEKMMVRDKFLKAQNEIGSKLERADTSPIDSAAWLSERIVATSRCGKVFLWNADSTLSSCIARLPREKSTKVTSLHAFNQEALLLVVESGRELEVWVAAGFAPDVSSASLELRQTIRLLGDDPSDVFMVTSVDPYEELVILSNVKASYFFVLHYNRIAQAFDAITEVPVKQPILSFCMTRNIRRSAAAIGAQVLNAEPVEELGIWCVQPRGIWLLHLPSRDCAPKSLVKPEVHPKSTQKTVMRKVERGPPTSGMSVVSSSAMSSRPAKESMRAVSAGPPSHTVPKRQTQSAVDSAMTNQGQASVIVPGALVNQHRSTGAATGAPGGTTVLSTTVEDAKKPGVGTSNPAPPVPSTHVQGLSIPPAASEPPPNADDVTEAIIDAAKKAIASFDQAAGQRSASEKVKNDRLIDSVTETAKSNLERFVNSSMKRILAETLIPGMSKIISDTRTAMRNAKVDPKVTTEYFEAALEKSSINKSFSSACQEMERQVTVSVTQSMSSKYEALISPAVNVVNDAAEDLSTSVSLLRKQISELKVEENKPGSVVEIGPEDIRRTIEEEIGRGNIDGAFQTALDKEDLSLVTWLCAKFDSSSFFETHSLSQVSLLSLAQQLGLRLAEGDVQLKVDWLRELMLVLEPESDDIGMIAQDAVKQLLNNVSELRKNKAVLALHDGLEKSLKTLNRLIASHIPN